MKIAKLAAIAAILAAFAMDSVALAGEKAKKPKLDTKPGPAYRMLEGKVKNIQGDVYTVEDYEGNEVQVYVSKQTKKLRGSKKAGDSVRAEITAGHHANSIQ
ncbi:hypothetical protein YTPLAS18_10900 [Nitrospira sp.]|nr:hypothetical protein YTPLAS18_10900 [Nitrospira sp.]